MRLNQNLSFRLSPAEMEFLQQLAEAQGVTPGQAARAIIQVAQQDGRDASRLNALENRLGARLDAMQAALVAEFKKFE